MGAINPATGDYYTQAELDALSSKELKGLWKEVDPYGDNEVADAVAEDPER